MSINGKEMKQDVIRKTIHDNFGRLSIFKVDVTKLDKYMRDGEVSRHF